MDLKNYLSKKKTVIDRALQSHFPEPVGLLSDIIKALQYSLFAGGKRLRPVLCMAGAEAVGGNGADVVPVACALELIHTFSLIHDDLPVMDDDDTRRGKPSNHRVFGEGLALLAGDGLMIDAFALITTAGLSPRISPENVLEVTGLIARAAGYQGMVGGQAVDIQSEGKTVGLSTVEFIHTRKTGALIAASVISGAILGNGDETQIMAVTSYGKKTGLAFQISDDILDIEGNSSMLGKKAGADRQKKKITYPSVVGLNKSKKIQADLVESAIESLEVFDNKADPLRHIARYIIDRKN